MPKNAYSLQRPAAYLIFVIPLLLSSCQLLGSEDDAECADRRRDAFLTGKPTERSAAGMQAHSSSSYDPLAPIAAAIPGFGGYYYASGALNIYLLEPDQQTAEEVRDLMVETLGFTRATDEQVRAV